MPKNTAKDLLKDIENYKALLEKASSKSDGMIIPNTGELHASLLMAKLFEISQSDIKMVVGDFCGDVSDDDLYLQRLTEKINNGITFEVIILGEPNSDSLALNKLIEASKKGRIDLYLGNDKVRQVINSKLHLNWKEVHFSVFDGKHFRYEIDPDNFKALGGFNKSETASKLVETFNVARPFATRYSPKTAC